MTLSRYFRRLSLIDMLRRYGNPWRKGRKAVTSGYRALAISITALLIFTAVSSAACETKRLRQQCIDDCRIETTTCTTRCKTEDCLNACTEPLGSCINKCREMYPRKTQ